MRANQGQTHKIRKTVAVSAGVVVIALATVGCAWAYSVAPGWTASDYVTGFDFQQPDHAGPVGLAFDRSGNLFIGNAWTGSIYKAPPGGGTAASTLLRDHIVGSPSGLVFDKNANLYMALPLQHSVVEVNPANGATIRTVASGLACPLGLAIDPISGDLFVSNTSCDQNVVRITDFSSGPGTVSQYAVVSEADGLAFAPDGTLYAAGNNALWRVTGNPATATKVATLPGADGIGFLPATPTAPGQFLVNRTDGEIDTVSLDGATVTPIVTGTGRGDFLTVGPDQCAYADLQDRVIKIGPASGACTFAPPSTGGGSGGSGGGGTGGSGGGGTGGSGGSGGQARLVDTAVAATAPKTARVGRPFTLKFVIRDNSTFLAHAPKVTSTLPRGTKFVRVRRSVKGVTCKRHGRTLTCGMRSLAGGKSFTVRVTVRAMRGKSWTGTARVRSTDLDPQPGNNKSQTRTMRR
jgi:hypothetical protein